jgi:hypothetical protein
MNFYTFAGDQRSAIQAGTAVSDGSFYPKRAEGPYNGYPGADPGDDDTPPSGDVRNNYNMVLKGYFYPPKTGKLQLAIVTDDPGQLYFSTDDSPVNKRLIATESQWNPVRAFGGGGDPTAPTRRSVVSTGAAPVPRPENWSAYIDVTQGKPYYLEGVGTEFGGGDNLAIAFRYEGDPDFADADKPISGKYLSPFNLPTAPVIFTQPEDAAVYAGGTATFSVAVDAPPTITVSNIKWTKNGTDVPDSNGLSLSVKAAAADDGAKYKATITTSGGVLVSREATLSVATLSSEFTLGLVKFEAWKGIGGNAVNALLDDPHYQDPPDDVRLLTAVDTPNGYADSYGALVSGFIVPAESAQYEFFIRSDDASQLYLSVNETPPKPGVDAPVCEETGCCDAFHPSGDPETSAPIAMVAGRKYAFIAIVKEGGGGDYLQVAMRKVGDTSPLQPISGSVIGVNSRPTKGEPQITKQPVLPAMMQEGQPWSLSVDGIVTPTAFGFPILVQWQKNGVNIAGANSKTFTIQRVSSSDSGTYRAVVSAPSGKSTNSLELVATVVSDKVPPTLATANKSFTSNTKVVVIFSEPVSAATANVAANYKINNGINVTAAALAANGKNVELTTSTIAAGSKNQLTVTGVQDVFGNVIAANSSIEVGVQKGAYLVTTDPGPLTFAGDQAVQQHLLDRGFHVELARGSDVPDDGSTAKGMDLIIETSTLGSGTVEVADPAGGPAIGKFKNLTIPAMNWEASSTDAFGFMNANASPGTTGGQTQVNIVDPTHPLAAGFPKGLVTVTGSETYSQGQPIGARIVATLANDPTQAIIFAYEKGDKGASGFVMPARRAFFFFQDNTAAVANDNGWKLFDAATDWLLGIEVKTPPPPPSAPALAVARTAGGLKLTFTGTLQSADAVTGPWTDVAGATSPRDVTATGGMKFYRTKQ